MKQLLTAALVALALAVVPAIAQEGPPAYLWVSFVKAKPGQGDAVIAEMIQEDSKVFDALVDSGAAWEWGVAMPVFHDGNDPYTHIEWVTLNGWAGADAFMKRFMENRQAAGAEGTKAMAERWAAITEPGSHADMVLRSLHNGAGKPTRATYIHLAYHKAQPGRFRDMLAAYREYNAPLMDKLVTDGTIQNYGLMTPDIHRGEGWDFMSWYKSDALAARDVVDDAWDAANAARSEEQRNAMRERARQNLDRSGHSDQVLLVVHHKFSPAE